MSKKIMDSLVILFLTLFIFSFGSGLALATPGRVGSNCTPCHTDGRSNSSQKAPAAKTKTVKSTAQKVSSSSGSKTTPALTTMNAEAVVKYAKITLRTGPSKTAKAVTTLTKNNRVTIVAKSGSYYKIRLQQGTLAWTQISNLNLVPKAPVPAKKPESTRAEINAAQWIKTKHSRTVDEGTGNPADNPHMRGGPAASSNCGKCHASQGFIDNLAAIKASGGFKATFSGTYGTSVFKETSITLKPLGPYPKETSIAGCKACHNQDGSLRITGIVGLQATSNNSSKPLMIVNAGKAAVCFMCHDYRKAPQNNIPEEPTSATKMSGPHAAAQTELLLGFGGAEFAGKIYGSSPHMAIPNSCVACHMAKSDNKDLGGHSYAVKNEKGTNLKACTSCHPGLDTFNRLAFGDYDGDKQIEGIQDEIEGLIHLVERVVATKLKTKDPSIHEVFPVSSGGQFNLMGANSLEPATPSYTHSWNGKQWVIDAQKPFWLLTQEESQAIYNAIYNLLLIEEEGSKGIHNPVYAVQLLQQSWIAINNSMTDPAPIPFRVK